MYAVRRNRHSGQIHTEMYVHVLLLRLSAQTVLVYYLLDADYGTGDHGEQKYDDENDVFD